MPQGNFLHLLLAFEESHVSTNLKGTFEEDMVGMFSRKMQRQNEMLKVISLLELIRNAQFSIDVR